MLLSSSMHVKLWIFLLNGCEVLNKKVLLNTIYTIKGISSIELLKIYLTWKLNAIKSGLSNEVANSLTKAGAALSPTDGLRLILPLQIWDTLTILLESNDF